MAVYWDANIAKDTAGKWKRCGGRDLNSATPVMAVPQRTLNWLYSVLTKDHYDPQQTYQDPNRAYHDVANALGQYPSLSPRTDVYTYENGFSALLLHIVGTLPVVFRGTTYRFPVALWIPSSYPREPPMVYVTPTNDMAVRMGQHVTLEGRVYHHYLAHWAEAWDRSNLVDLLSILRDVFAKEPPVRYRQQMPPPPQQTQTPPPIPPLPPGMGPSRAQNQPAPQPTGPAPPQLPPKVGAGEQPSQTAERYQSPPPLPPLPPKGHDPRQASIPSQMGIHSPASGAPRQFPPRSSVPPGQPISPEVSQGMAPYRATSGPVSPIGAPHQTPFPRHAGPPGSQPPQAFQQPPLQQHPGPPYPQHSPYPSGYQHPPPAAPAPKSEAPDLLTSPFELELPSFVPTGPAPPIPPNPEKDALLHAVSQALAETLRSQAAQSDSAAQSLVSQTGSLQNAMVTLQGEVTALNSLHTTLQTNTSTLQQSIHRADATIADAQARSASANPSLANPPETPSGLPRSTTSSSRPPSSAALVRGVIGVDLWSRQTRGLAREAFLKRALIRKIGRGMGLEEAVA
ncbi:hypothetical protein N7492_006720 [Penicillium capsulatum]|uniref:UEV domain-containing protein n=1 Tax=Penicillium capsulatum TaxID=69766 RepID=A0A9W9LL54_9EURO|nr:hypothetical protein N7492_006720 [Penicillium capsulatum]